MIRSLAILALVSLGVEASIVSVSFNQIVFSAYSQPGKLQRPAQTPKRALQSHHHIQTDAGPFTALSFPSQINSYTTVFSGFQDTSPTEAIYLAVPSTSTSTNGDSYQLLQLVSTADASTKLVSESEFVGLNLVDSGPTGMVVFVADTAEQNSAGVFAVHTYDVKYKIGQQIYKLADNSTLIPNHPLGDGVYFNDFDYASVDGPLVVLWGEDAAAEWAGIYVTSMLGDLADLQVIVDYATEIPADAAGGVEGQFFNYLSGPMIRNGAVVFFGSRKANTVSLEASYPIPGIFVYFLLTEQLVAVADRSTLVPFGASEDEFFVAFSDPGFDGETVAFIGEGSEGSYGIYAYHLNRGVLERVVDLNCQVPQGTTTFGTFTQPPSVTNNGIAVAGIDQNGEIGIYVYPKYSAEGCEGDLVVNSTMSFADSAVLYLGISKTAFRDDQVSFYAVTDTYSMGIFVADLTLSNEI